MNIVVLVKQVPDTESMIQIADDGTSIKTDDIKWIMNPYDEIAVEEALQIREAQGGEVTILSLGAQKAIEAIRTALAMGADKGIHLLDPAAEGSDALATAKILSAALKNISFDIIIAGHRAVDEDNYQVASAVAEFLDIPQISMVVKAELSDGKIKCHRALEGGAVVVEASLPALITTQRGLNEPRYASLPGIMKAKKKPVDVKTIADLGIDAASVGRANRTVKIKALNFPPQRQAVRMVEGESASEIAAQLVGILHGETKII
jgi:electron transfer flavoprotein beta subunit